jgi:hypothetical protein
MDYPPVLPCAGAAGGAEGTGVVVMGALSEGGAMAAFGCCGCGWG